MTLRVLGCIDVGSLIYGCTVFSPSNQVAWRTETKKAGTLLDAGLRPSHKKDGAGSDFVFVRWASSSDGIVGRGLLGFHRAICWGRGGERMHLQTC